MKKTNLQSQIPKFAEGSLRDKVALLFDGTCAGGRSLALSLAKQGINIALVFRQAHVGRAQEIKRLVEAEGRHCLIIPAQTVNEIFSEDKVQETLKVLGRLDILIDYSSPPGEDVVPANRSGIREKSARTEQSELFTHVDVIVNALDQMVRWDQTNDSG